MTQGDNTKVRIPTKVYEQVKQKAFQEGRTITSQLVRTIEKGLGK